MVFMPDILLILSLISGVPAILATLLALSRKEYWWIRLLDFPRLQILLLIFISLGFLIPIFQADHTYKVAYSGLLVLTAFYQAYKIWPYTVFHKLQALDAKKNDPKNQLSLVYSNVYMKNKNAAAALEQITRFNPDIILVVETDKWWQQALKPLENNYPHIAHYPLDNTYGMLFYSRYSFENKDFQFLVSNEIPSLSPVITLPSGTKVQCYFIHPKPPAPQEAKTSEQRDAELIIVAKKAVKSTLPVIVAGDLNDVGWSHTSALFQKISGLLDPRIGRGLFATFNAKYSFIRWPLDHVFHSKEFRVKDLKKLKFMGSDHFPIYIKLSYEPERSTAHDEPEPDMDDKKEAQRKLDNIQ